MSLAEAGTELISPTRSDKQNWNSAQRISFPVVQDCLQDIIDGKMGRKDESVKGINVFLKIVWYYAEIFCSPVAYLSTRIKYAGIVSHFLAIWHNWVKEQSDLELKRNFISNQSYTDILLSCSFAVSLICYMRDRYPTLPCNLSATGSDCVESYWSVNGQWVGNHHNYTFGELHRNLGHQVRLEQIRVHPNGPKFPKHNSKGESIWNKQYEEGFVQAQLNNYPADGEEIESWKAGIKEARQLALSVGMKPEDYNDTIAADGEGCSGSNSWFFKPFKQHNFLVMIWIMWKMKGQLNWMVQLQLQVQEINNISC